MIPEIKTLQKELDRLKAEGEQWKRDVGALLQNLLDDYRKGLQTPKRKWFKLK